MNKKDLIEFLNALIAKIEEEQLIESSVKQSKYFDAYVRSHSGPGIHKVTSNVEIRIETGKIRE